MKAKVEHVIRSARSSRHLAATFARNDLLFTMSDNTRGHERPWWARMQARFHVYGRAIRLIHGRVLQSKEFGRQDHRWWSQTGSNRRPPACKAGALPTE